MMQFIAAVPIELMSSFRITWSRSNTRAGKAETQIWGIGLPSSFWLWPDCLACIQRLATPLDEGIQDVLRSTWPYGKFSTLMKFAQTRPITDIITSHPGGSHTTWITWCFGSHGAGTLIITYHQLQLIQSVIADALVEHFRKLFTNNSRWAWRDLLAVHHHVHDGTTATTKMHHAYMTRDRRDNIGCRGCRRVHTKTMVPLWEILDISPVVGRRYDKYGQPPQKCRGIFVGMEACRWDY